MATLIDTNILLRSVQPSHSMHAVAVTALQNVAEFWSVATRPEKNNGLGFTTREAHSSLTSIENFFQILGEDAASYAIWKSMLTKLGISGVQVHDARLAAVMKVHGIARIVTFNVSGFARFPEIEAVHPEDLG